MQKGVRLSILLVLFALSVFTAITLFAPSLLGRFYLRSGDVYLFPDLVGPDQMSLVGAGAATDWRQFSAGSSSRMAVLLTDADSAWLGLAHGLKAIGLPFIITDDPARALQHKVVMVYPILAGSVLAPDALQGLAAHVRNGGTLIGVNVLGGGLNPVFGFDSVRDSRDNMRVNFSSESALSAEFEAAEERQIRIALGSPSEKTLGTHEYLEPRYPPVATYANGAAAITARRYGSGYAYAIGFDPGLFLQKGHGYRLEGLAPAYVNAFEPTSDVILRLLTNIYRQGEASAVTAHTVPWNRQLSVSITHDIDYNRSLENAVEYARMERGLGVTGTYFIQTKYIRDWNDKVFFNQASLSDLRALVDLGMEVASHSVSHSKLFSKFPLGDGSESYPDYVPFVYSERQAFAGTVLGELRVSKFLLDQFSGAPRVRSFRAGHLENPFVLPQALAASGYRYDSTITANNAMTHLPYRLNHQRGMTSEVEVWEFPVTIEDEREPAFHLRLPESLAVADKLAAYGGHFVVLVHPNETGEKLESIGQLIEALQPRAWFGSIGEFGAWWEAREAVQIDVDAQPEKLRLSLSAPRAIAGLTLVLPDGVNLLNGQKHLARQQGNRLILEKFQGRLDLLFQERRP